MTKIDKIATKFDEVATEFGEVAMKFDEVATRFDKIACRLLHCFHAEGTKLLQRCYEDSQPIGQRRLPAIAMKYLKGNLLLQRNST